MRRTNPDGTSETGELYFRVDAALLFQLGEQLVTKRAVALAELVKNAYDADATKVVIRFEKVSKAGGTIAIEDNGTGMLFRDIQRAWMTIATPEKLYDPLSKIYRRPRTGAKGVGRFAARRLANSLRLKTVASVADQSRREEVEISFDWTSFAEGQAIEVVGNRYKRRMVSSGEPCGTTLQLLDVREAWTDNDIEEMRRNLSEIISPFPAQKLVPSIQADAVADPGFSIEVQAPEYPESSGKIEDQFLEAALATLYGYLDESGVPAYEALFRDETDKSRFNPEDLLFPEVGLAAFEIRFFVYKKEYFKGLPFRVRQASVIGKERAGVRIFYNNFLVPGYGEPGDDWLYLNFDVARRVGSVPTYLTSFATGTNEPLLNLPSSRQVFGAVYLSKEDNPNLQITLSRERLVETDSFEQLRDFVRAGINWLTVLYARRLAKTKNSKVSRDEARPSPAKSVAQVALRVQDLREKLRAKHEDETAREISASVPVKIPTEEILENVERELQT